MTQQRRPGTDRQRARSRALVVGLAVALAVVPGLAGSPAAAAGMDAWSSATAGPGNAAYNPGESVVTSATAPRVAPAWVAKEQQGLHTAPTVVGGVVYYVDNRTDNAALPSRLIAASPRTGAVLWSLLLPAAQGYPDGITVVGDRAVLAYQGLTQRAGITAVDLRTHRVVWNRPLPPLPAQYSWIAPWLSGHVIADSTRVYVAGGSIDLAALRLSDGALLWNTPMTAPTTQNIAVANGILYATGGPSSTPTAGLTAYSAATGRRLWRAPGGGVPVVAGQRVVSTTSAAVVAVAAGGCGRSTCPAVWTRAIPDADQRSMSVWGADPTTLFLSYNRTVSGPDLGVVQRLSAATGAVQWSATVGGYVVGSPARGGDAIWLLTWTQFPDAYRLKAFRATGTDTRPLRTITQTPGIGNADEDISVGSGSVLVQAWPQTLTAYRVPGT